MVKNFGGNKTKAKSRKHFHAARVYSFEDLKKIQGQEYAWVNKNLGDGRYDTICYDKVKRMGILRGSLKKQSSKIDKNSIVLVSLREFQDEKCDILAIFTDDDINKLVYHKEITESFSKDGILANDIQNMDETIQTIEQQNMEESEDDDSLVIDINDI